MTRAERRHHVERMKARVRRRDFNNVYDKNDPAAVGIHAGTRKRCGGACCSNRRKWHGPTLKEAYVP